MLKYLGFLIILGAALLIAREYAKNQKKRLSECEELSRLIKHIRTEISCFLTPASDWLSGFRSETLAECGFLEEAVISSSLSEAFSRAGDKLSLGDEERRILTELFSSLGRSYRDDEVSLIDKYYEEFEICRGKLISECGKNIKIVNTIAACSAVGLIILLI